MEGGQRRKQRGLVGGSTARIGEGLLGDGRGQPLQGGEVVVEVLRKGTASHQHLRNVVRTHAGVQEMDNSRQNNYEPFPILK